MSVAGWRRLGWILTCAGAVVAYLGLRTYADHARSMEAVLGLFHGDPLWHAVVAAATIGMRVVAYAIVGGTLVAWPLEEVLLLRASASAESETDSNSVRLD